MRKEVINRYSIAADQQSMGTGIPGAEGGKTAGQLLSH